MKTYSTQIRRTDWACQSRVVRSKHKLRGALNRWSVQLMRSRSRHGGVERRTWTLFVSAGRFRGEIGTR